ncbi:spermatogenesis-associated protein 33 isoform X2 [Castor canadensis]|uniref:Spermatogenesis-associated protein 33 n=2 Tax=Castor canadensis TaxID=51338 RepID=A0A8B7VBZ4_CASCN|nr:spermatogenesis-associated protein 33 [Castor canadensis]
MGLSKSKPKERKGEEEKKGLPYSFPKPKDKLMEERSPKAEQADREAKKPADSLLLGLGTVKHERLPASSEEKPDVKQKLSKKKTVTPQVIITRASNESIISYNSTGSEEQRTIQEQAEWGIYHRHRSPSTIAAYLYNKE